MLNRWYRKNECNADPNYINFTYRNLANFHLIRQIQVHYCKIKKYFLVSLFTPSVLSQEKVVECYKTTLTKDEFEKNIHCYRTREISINTEAIFANCLFLKKIINVLEQIKKVYPESISVEIIKELEKIFSHQFDKPFISEISTWQDVPAYVNPLHEPNNNLVQLTRRFRLCPKTIKPTLYLNWLKEGENPNQKDEVGKTVLFMLSERYSLFKEEGVEAHAYKVIQVLIFYGADIFAENGFEYMSAAEKLDHLGFPDIFRKIIIANSRVEKPLKIKSVEQSFNNDVITTEFKFQEKSTNDIVTKLIPVDKFHEDQTLVNKSYELFRQTFEAPDGSEDKIKKEFSFAFTSDKSEKILVEIIYAKLSNDKMQLIGFTIYKIFNNQKNIILNIEYSLVDKKYRFGLMTFLDFRIGFCLTLLNPNLQSTVFFCAAHLNSYELIKRLFFSPKYNVLGAERVIKEMLGENANMKMVKRDITWTREESLRVRGGYFTKPAEDIHQQMFYEYIMGFVTNPAQPDKLIPPDSPVSALICVPNTLEFIMEMQKAGMIHGIDFYNDVIIPLVGLLPKLDASLGQARYVGSPVSSFPKSLSLFAPPEKLNDPVKCSQKMIGIKSRL